MARVKTDPKILYAYTRSKMYSKDTVGPLVDQQGTIVSDSSVICSILNQYFSSVFTRELSLDNLPEVRQLIDNLDEYLIDIEIGH